MHDTTGLVSCQRCVLAGYFTLLEVAMVGAGKSATIEDTGFLKSYDGLASASDNADPGLPDLYYISPRNRMESYNKVIITDFSSLATDVRNLRGLQIRQYKTIKQDLADHMAETFDGSIFETTLRIHEKIKPRDLEAMRKLPADGVLMGNIKEIVSLGGENNAGLTAIQVEYKLVDVKTGEEVIKAIHRSTTDLDKVAMAQVRTLSALINKAKNIPQN